MDGISVEAEEDRTGVAQDDGRVSRNEKVGVPWCREIVDDFQE